MVWCESRGIHIRGHGAVWCGVVLGAAWSVGRLVHRLIGWLVGWSVGWSVGQSVGRLVSRSVGWSVARLFIRLFIRLFVCLFVCLFICALAHLCVHAFRKLFIPVAGDDSTLCYVLKCMLYTQPGIYRLHYFNANIALHNG